MAVTPDETSESARSYDRSAGVGPSPLPFRCDVSLIEDRAIVAVRGEVDIATAPELQRQVLATLASPIRGLVLDLGYVSFMDSSGIAVLVAAIRKAQALGLALTLSSVPRHVRQVVEVSGLTEQLGLSQPPNSRVVEPAGE